MVLVFVRTSRPIARFARAPSTQTFCGSVSLCSISVPPFLRVRELSDLRDPCVEKEKGRPTAALDPVRLNPDTMS